MNHEKGHSFGGRFAHRGMPFCLRKRQSSASDRAGGTAVHLGWAMLFRDRCRGSARGAGGLFGPGGGRVLHTYLCRGRRLLRAAGRVQNGLPRGVFSIRIDRREILLSQLRGLHFRRFGHHRRQFFLRHLRACGLQLSIVGWRFPESEGMRSVDERTSI
jgi:hypothetical protein